MSTLPGGRGLVAVKGAPETIKGMLAVVPEKYDEVYKSYTRRGSRVLALGMKEFDSISRDKVRSFLTFLFGMALKVNIGCGDVDQ